MCLQLIDTIHYTIIHSVKIYTYINKGRTNDSSRKDGRKSTLNSFVQGNLMRHDQPQYKAHICLRLMAAAIFKATKIAVSG